MGLDFTSKRVLVTGSTMGIGRGAVEMFLESGAQVAVNGRNPDTVATAIEEMGEKGLVAAPGDVGTIEGCRAVVDAAIAGLGGLDVLVNNTGICPLARVGEITEEHWDEVINVNLRSALFCAKFAMPELRKSKGNVVTPVDLLDQHGSDAVRYWAANGRPGTDTAFDDGQMKIGRRLAIKVLNAIRFTLGFGADGDTPLAIDAATITHLLERYLLLMLADLVDEVDEDCQCESTDAPE